MVKQLKKKTGEPTKAVQNDVRPSGETPVVMSSPSEHASGQFTFTPELQALIDQFGLRPLIEQIRQKDKQLDQVTATVNQLYQAVDKIAEQLVQKGILTLPTEPKQTVANVPNPPQPQEGFPFSPPVAAPVSTGQQLIGLLSQFAPTITKTLETAFSAPQQPEWITEHVKATLAQQLAKGNAELGLLDVLTKIYKSDLETRLKGAMTPT